MLTEQNDGNEDQFDSDFEFINEGDLITLKRAINNLEEFSLKIIELIASDSEKNRLCLNKIFENTKNIYSNENSIWSWISWLTRGRKKETKNEINKFSTSPVRLQEFKKFISEGDWTSTSANTRLFIDLINSIDGYVREPETILINNIIPFLRPLINDEIERRVKLYEHGLEQKAIEEKRKILAEQARQEKVRILYSESEAAEEAINNPEKQIFCLALLAPSKWRLTWYDFMGKVHRLPIDGGFKEHLEQIKAIEQVNEQENLSLTKMYCNNLVESLLKRIKVLVNPTQMGTLTFALTKKDKFWQLDWHNSFSKPQSIDIQNYPELLEWLSTKNRIEASDLATLKIYLQHVIIKNEGHKDTQAILLKGLESAFGVALILTDNWQPNSENVIEGTYFLTRESDPKMGEWVLYQRQTQNVNKRFALNKEDVWKNLHALLIKNNHCSAEQLNSEIKEELRGLIKIAQEEIVKSNKKSEEKDEKSHQIKVIPVKDFMHNQIQKEVKNQYDSNSFIITNRENKWCLYYIDLLQRPIPVAIDEIANLKNLLANFKQLGQLSKDILHQMSLLLSDYKPASSSLKQHSSYQGIQGFLEKKLKEKLNQEQGETFQTQSTNENENEKKLIKKIPLGVISALQNKLGGTNTTVEVESSSPQFNS